MAGTFTQGKYTIPFDEDLFMAYWGAEPDMVRDAMVESGVLAEDERIASLIREGGDVYTIPFAGLLSQNQPLNYDGETDLAVYSMGAGSQSGIVYGRMQGWYGDQFAKDFTAFNPLQAIASRTAKYWQNYRQERIVATTEAVLGVSAMAGHTVTKSGLTATTMDDAAQEVWGVHGNEVSLVIMHSAVAQVFKRLQVLDYWKYTDENGIQRTMSLANLNGRTVVVDDGVPKVNTASSGGVYAATFAGKFAAGDVVSLAGTQLVLDATSAASPTAAATAMVTALGTMADYTVTRSAAVVTLTEKEGHYGLAAPKGSANSHGGSVTVSTTTAPVVTATSYATYLFRPGALLHATAPVTMPVEVWRDPKKRGGTDELYNRVRETIHPNGFSFTKPSGAGASVTDAQLADSANWSLAYSDPMAIPFAKVLTPAALLS